MLDITAMNALNAAQETGAVNFDQGLVKQEAMEQMQEVSVADLPEPTINEDLVSLVEETVVSEPVQLARVTASLLVNFGFDNPLFNNGTVKELRAVTIGDRELNLYNPLAKEVLEKKIKPGILREAMLPICNIISTINTSNLSLLGTDSQVEQQLAAFAQQKLEEANDALALAPTDIVLDLESNDETGDSVLSLQFNDIVNFSAWVASEQVDGVQEYTVYFNLHLNVGVLYDSREPGKIYTQCVNVLTRLCESIADYVSVSIQFRSFDLFDKRVTDFIDSLSADGAQIVSRNDSFINASAYPWLPFGNNFFAPNSDFALMAPLVGEEA